MFSFPSPVQATQWCDAVSSTSSSPSSSSSTCPLASLPPIPPSRFQDARSLAMELGGGALLDLWTQTVERYQRTVAQVKPRFLQSERAQNQGQGKPKTPSASSLWDLMGPEGDGDWGLGAGGGEGGLQSWGSLASLFRPQTCSTLKIGEEKGNKREGAGGGTGGAGGGKFLQNLLNPAKKSVSWCIALSCLCYVQYQSILIYFTVNVILKYECLPFTKISDFLIHLQQSLIYIQYHCF